MDPKSWWVRDTPNGHKPESELLEIRIEPNATDKKRKMIIKMIKFYYIKNLFEVNFGMLT